MYVQFQSARLQLPDLCVSCSTRGLQVIDPLSSKASVMDAAFETLAASGLRLSLAGQPFCQAYTFFEGSWQVAIACNRDCISIYF